MTPISHITRLLFLSLFWIFSVTAHAATITFEDFALPGDPVVIPDGYQGFNWSFGGGIKALNFASGYAGTGYENGATSGTHVAYNENGAAETRITWAGPGTFELVQAHWSSAWLASHNVIFQGRNNGMEVYSPMALTLNNSGPTLQVFNWTGIDELVILSGNLNSQWVLDDLQFMAAPISAVPEPSSLILLGCALPLIVFALRSRQRELKN